MSKQRILGDLAHNLDSSAVGSFLAKSSAGGDFQSVDYSSITGTPSVVLDSSLTSQLIDSSYIQLRETPSTSGIDSATALNLIDSSYLNNINGTNTGFVDFYYNATAGQTIFDSDLRGRNLSYEEGGVMVYLNGVMLAPSQYTATDGTTVVLDSGASLSDEITVVKFGLGSSGGGGSAGNAWSGDRGLIMGGRSAQPSGGYYYSVNPITYIDITTPGNATDFGDLGARRETGDACSNKTRGIWGGGKEDASRLNVIEYVTISTPGNTTDFGDLRETITGPASSSDGTVGIWAAGYSSGGYPAAWKKHIDTVTMDTTGNATDFGDLINLGGGTQLASSFGDATRGIITGGSSIAASGDVNMQYITFATPGNGTDFGDQTVGGWGGGSCSDATRGVTAGGNGASFNYSNTIDYVTIQTTGNATDFGDLTTGANPMAASANATIGTFALGRVTGNSYVNTIDYITIQTPGNSTDFGDNTAAVGFGAGCSGNAS